MISRWRDLDVRWKWAIVLLVLGSLILTNIGVVQFYISEHSEDANALNTAGRQRLLLQTMMTQAERIEAGELTQREELARVAHSFETALEDLRTGENGHPNPTAAEARSIQTISQRWSSFRPRLKTLQTASPQSDSFRTAYEYVRATQPTLLEESDELVLKYQRASERKLRALQHWVIGLGGLDLLAVFGIWLGISRSVVRPLEALKRDTLAVARGDLDRDISGASDEDDLGTTTRSVRELKEQLVSAVNDVRGFREAVDQAGHAIYLTDIDGTITYANPAFEKITGYSPEEAIGQNPSILSSEERPDEFYDDLWQQILGGEVWEGEMINRTKQGERYIAHQTIAPVSNEKGEINQFVAVVTEVTEDKRREQVIEVLNRVLRHNLRNDCNVIMTRASIIKRDRLGSLTAMADRLPSEQTDSSDSGDVETANTSAEKEPYSVKRRILSVADQIDGDATSIHESAESLNSTGEKARDIQQVLTGSSDEGYLDLEAAIERELDFLSQEHPATTLSATFEIEGRIEIRSYLLAGILEVIRNAVTHTDPPVCVDISVTHNRGQSVEIAVSDNGQGIPNIEEPDLEESLLKGGQSTPLNHPSGVGLWLVNWSVKMAGGSLNIKQNEPSGSIVTISLPLSTDTTRCRPAEPTEDT